MKEKYPHPSTMTFYPSGIATKIALKTNNMTYLTNKEIEEEFDRDDFKKFIASEIKQAEERVVREIVKEIEKQKQSYLVQNIYESDTPIIRASLGSRNNTLSEINKTIESYAKEHSIELIELK